MLQHIIKLNIDDIKRLKFNLQIINLSDMSNVRPFIKRPIKFISAAN